jgi:Zn-dependent protease
MNIPPLPIILAQAIVLFLGIGLHEFAHCKFADMAGDPTPGSYGRVTLNLFKHFEPIGTFMMIMTTMTGFGIGWGRPAPMDPKKMKNPRWDFFAAVAAGPITNLLQAIAYAMILRTLKPSLGEDDFLSALLLYGVLINLGLFMFNLIPFGPLDGQWLVGMLLPEKARWRWFKFNIGFGIPGLFVIVLILQTTHVSLVSGPVTYLFNLLTGIRL